MENSGYVYALINTSMKGLVKIGKTTRSSEERAKELSNASGVASPFIVAYEIYVSDCTKAEVYLHTIMEERDYRISDNREFFNIPLDKLIPIMIDVKSIFHTEDNNIEINNKEGSQFSSNIGKDKFHEAMKCYNGDDNYLQDYHKAIKLFKQATKLNVSEAYYWLGEIYRLGKGCKIDYNIALKYYKDGADLKYDRCYVKMVYLYQNDLNHSRNAEKCINKFILSNYFNSLTSEEQQNYLLAFALNRGGITIRYYLDEPDYYKLGAMYYCAGSGIMVEGKEFEIRNRIFKSKMDAVELFTKSVKLGSAYAFDELAYHYYNGIGCNKDVNKGIKLSKIGANHGNIMCWEFLADHFEEMREVELSKKCYKKYEILDSLNSKNISNIDKSNYQDGFFFEIDDEEEFIKNL